MDWFILVQTLAGLIWRNNMANYEATRYDFTGSNLTGIEGIPTATIVPWSSASVPTGFLECNGLVVSRSTYADLFAIVRQLMELEMVHLLLLFLICLIKLQWVNQITKL